MMRTLLLVCFMCLSAVTYAGQKVLNVYNWTEFIPNDVLHEFEEETGIQVNYSTYDSNATLYAKLKTAGHMQYDVIFPSDLYVQRMIKQDMLAPLDDAQLPNRRELDPRFLHLHFDQHNRYSLPFLWSSTLLMVNKRYLDPHSIKSWRDLWHPRFRQQLLLLDDAREVFALALLKNGLSVNTTAPKDLQRAYEDLQHLLPNVRLFNAIATANILIDEDVHIGVAWSGDAAVAQVENPDLVAIYPKEGFVMGMDCMAIPKGAPHPKAAHQFINFLMRPKIAKRIVEFTRFMAPNRGAQALLAHNILHNQTINPDAQTLKRGHYLQDLGATTEVIEQYWQRLKVAGAS